MEVVKTTLDGVLLIRPNVNVDFRGDYVMTYNKALYKAMDIKADFVEEDISTSMKNVLRGIHYSPSCWKLYQCLYGSLYYVIVNCDDKSPEFGKWEAFVISDRNRWQIYKPPQYGAGMLVLSDFAILHYMQSEYYNPDNPNQSTFMWNDKRFRVFWPCESPILSQRDTIGEYVK